MAGTAAFAQSLPFQFTIARPVTCLSFRSRLILPEWGHPALGKQFLHIATAKREAAIEPHRVSDHVRETRWRLPETGSIAGPASDYWDLERELVLAQLATEAEPLSVYLIAPSSGVRSIRIQGADL